MARSFKKNARYIRPGYARKAHSVDPWVNSGRTFAGRRKVAEAAADVAAYFAGEDSPAAVPPAGK